MTLTTSKTPDVLIENAGTVFTFCPLTTRAKEWMDTHVEPDAQWFDSTLVVEHRYAWGLCRGYEVRSLILR